MNESSVTQEELTAEWEAIQHRERVPLEDRVVSGAKEMFAVLRRYPESEWGLILTCLGVEQELYYHVQSFLLFPDDPQFALDTRGLELALRARHPPSSSSA